MSASKQPYSTALQETSLSLTYGVRYPSCIFPFPILYSLSVPLWKYSTRFSLLDLFDIYIYIYVFFLLLQISIGQSELVFCAMFCVIWYIWLASWSHLDIIANETDSWCFHFNDVVSWRLDRSDYKTISLRCSLLVLSCIYLIMAL